MGWLGNIFKKSAEAYEERGDAYFKQNDWVQAKQEYDSALDQLKNDNMAQSYQIERVQKKFRSSIDKLVIEHQQNAKNLIKNYLFDDAIELLQLALSLSENENSKYDIQELIRSAQEKAQQTESKDDEISSAETEDEIYFTVLVETLPEPLQKAYLGYGENFQHGYVALNYGEYETAVKSLTQAKQENSQDSFIPFELASALINLERTEEAKLLLEEFITHHPDYSPAYRMLSELYWDEDKYELTETLLSNLPEKLADSGDFFLLRGDSKYQNGKFSEAESIFHEILERDGWDEDIAIRIADAKEAMDEPYLASQIYEKIITSYEKQKKQIPLEFKRKFANLLFATSKLSPTLLQMYLSLTEEDPDNAREYNENISQIFTSLDDEESAREYHIKAQK